MAFDGQVSRHVYDEQLSVAFHRYAEFVWRTARGLGCGPTTAEDVVQEVFAVTLRRLRATNDPGRCVARPWFYAVTRRVVAGVRRKEQRRDRFLGRLRAQQQLNEVEEPQAMEDKQDAWTLVQKVYACLRPPLRDVLLLSQVEGLTAPEIAELQGVKVNTVSSRLRRARQELEHLRVRMFAREVALFKRIDRGDCTALTPSSECRRGLLLLCLGPAAQSQLWSTGVGGVAATAGPGVAAAGSSAASASSIFSLVSAAVLSLSKGWAGLVLAALVAVSSLGLLAAERQVAAAPAESPVPSTRVAGAPEPAEPALPVAEHVLAANASPRLHPGSFQNRAQTERSTQRRADLRRPEFGLLARARRAFAAGNYALVLELTAQYLRQHPHGELVETILVLRVQAHCENGAAATAVSVAKILRARFPKARWIAGSGQVCGRAL